MQICCTKKLLDYIGVAPDCVEAVDSFYSWHANLLTIYRRKALLIVNDKTRYAILLLGIKKLISSSYQNC